MGVIESIIIIAGIILLGVISAFLMVLNEYKDEIWQELLKRFDL